MWPGRRYWIWNVGLWLSLMSLLDVAYGSDGVAASQLVVGTLLMTCLWGIVAIVLWFILRGGHVEGRPASEWLWFAGWVLLAVAAALAALALSPLLLLPAAAAAVLLAYVRGLRRSVYGLLSGVGGMLIVWMQWDNQHLRTDCWRIAPNGDACPNHAQFLLPTAFGVVLIVLGVTAQRRPRESRADSSD